MRKNLMVLAVLAVVGHQGALAGYRVVDGRAPENHHAPQAVATPVAYRTFYAYEGNQSTRLLAVERENVALKQLYGSEWEAGKRREISQENSAATPVINTAHDNKVNSELIRYINNAVQSGEMHPSVALKLMENLAPKNPKWEILEADRTLQNTFARWGKTANWEIKWLDIPEIKNPGHVSLPEGDFLTTASHVLKQAQRAAKAAGMELAVKAYPNRVLVISKANTTK